MTRTTIAAATVLAGLAGVAPAQDAPAARWEPRQAQFRFVSDVLYSCEALERKIRALLLAAGARDDAVVDVCDQPTLLHIKLGFSAAVPAQAGPTTETFPAQWSRVDVNGLRARELDRADCMLMRDFGRQVLPLFAVRDLQPLPSCGPGTINPSLRFTALKPAPPAK
ncbi:MAG: hypothetical protein AB7Q97_20740 [Gammaproteobacteria bacterium]